MNQIPRLPLAFLPTPLEHAERLTKELKGPEIYIKRDDLTGLAFGGNKVRKLEYIIPDLKSRGVDTIVTTDHVQSNWARQTVAAARKAGMKVALVLRTIPSEGNPEEYDGNLLLDYMMGADIRIVESAEASSETVEAVLDEYRKKGFHPELLDIQSAEGPLSAVGYVKAAEEISEQVQALNKEADYVFVTAGVSGTQAGLVTGFKWLKKRSKVIGINCGFYDKDGVSKAVEEACNGASEILRLGIRVTPEDIIVQDDYTCGGYRKTSPELVETIKFVAKTEGLLLDPSYTGKTMMGLIDLIRKGQLKKDETIVFVHTGGLPALFQARRILTEGERPPIL